jgi:hypothetical protein
MRPLPFRLLPLPLPLACLVCAAACASARNREVPSVADKPTALAQVAAEFIPDPARIEPSLAEGQDFVAPHPITRPMPLYPPGREDERGPVVVVLRFIVETDGAVGQVRDSPLAGATPADPAFRKAAEDALLNWVFVPAAIQTIQPGEDLDHDSKPDYTILVDSNRVPTYLDVRFTFEIVDGEARVRAD